jgi:uracil DNA glycosylase superfamily protein
MNAQGFVDRLSQLSLPNVFNPYRESCGEHDHSESPTIRCLNLQIYLEAAIASGADSVWLGRDCGYRGARRTGIALTDEVQLETLGRHFGIGGMAKATASETVRERTATQVWKIIREVNAKVFLWNVFPFHPFESGNEMSNRRHTAREFEECKDLLLCLIELVSPKMIVALGADAHNAAARVDLRVWAVRHPSYGGHLEFAEAIRKLYKQDAK